MSQTQLLYSVLTATKRSTHTSAESLGSPPGRPRCAPWSSFLFYKIPPVGLLQFAVGKGILEKKKKVKRLASSSQNAITTQLLITQIWKLQTSNYITKTT